MALCTIAHDAMRGDAAVGGGAVGTDGALRRDHCRARVVDGSGSPWFLADIGIRGDSIAAVGALGNASAAIRIDAKGMVVAPGFMDIHSHGRRGIAAVSTAENYLREGVTTIVEGPDGSSPPSPGSTRLPPISRKPSR